jgi:HD superfamily phosphodiesterase
MSIDKCPGQDKRFWKPGDVFEAPCPHCGAAVEFWKDEPRRRCRSCGKTAPNPKFDMGCAKWCKYAEACLGRPASETDEALCDSILAEVKNTFGPDERRVRHALEVLDYAEKILAVEKGDPLVVRAAALLHDIGIREAERVHGSAAGKFQELEGPPIARRILEHLGVDKERTDHIARIVGSHHSAAGIDTTEFRIIWDADRLANIPEECAGKALDQALSFVRRAYRTETGRALGEAAVERYLAADSLPRKT